MTPQDDPVLAAIQTERQQIEERLAVLIDMEKRLTGKIPTPLLRVNNSHTPAGVLKKAQLAALKGAGEITSSDLKKRVLEAGYKFRLNGQVWTSSLRKMVDDGILVKKANGSFSSYRLKR